MKLPEFDISENRREFIHAVLGGGLCFLIMFITIDIAQTGLQQILVIFGYIGVTIFQQYLLAASIILLGVVYLPAGFIGGLYTGHQTDKNLKILLGVTGIVSSVVFITMLYFIGVFSNPNTDYIHRVLLPLVGNIAGAYLGGYAINWPSEEEESNESLSVDL